MSSSLALLGGPKTITELPPDFSRWPWPGGEEEAAVLEVLRGGEWSLPQTTFEFEREFAAYLGSPFALAHTNGTSAIHSALFAVGVKPGDEVISQAYTYWATIMPALCLGAVPVFAEVEERTLCLDPEDVERKVTPRTRAIVVVHLHGQPADMDAISSIARPRGIAVVEDASHAHGARLNGRPLGTLGEVGAFSLQSSKLLPSGEGGILVTAERDLYERACLLGHYERIGSLENEAYRRYARTCYGYKYRINPLAAAIARVQLRHLDERNALRNHNVDRFNAGIGGLPGLRAVEGVPGAEAVHYQNAMLYMPDELGGLSRDRFLQACSAEGAGMGAERYIGLHAEQIFLDLDRDGRSEMYAVPRREDGRPRYGAGTLPRTESVIQRAILTPTFASADDALVDLWIAAIRKVVENYRDLL